LAIAHFKPTWGLGWSACHLASVTGLALLLFSICISPLPDWAGLPPREAELELRWEQVFASRPESKTISGIAQVTSAPTHLKALVGNDLYCQIRRPFPPTMPIHGSVFQAIGYLDTAERSFSASDSHGFLRYLKHRRAVMTITRGRFIEMHKEPGMIQQWCLEKSAFLESVLRRGSGSNPDSANLLVAMLLGQKSAMPEEARIVFSRTGTMHLFAISGLHIGVIAAGLFWIGKRIRCSDTFWRLFILATLLVFVMVTGAAPSALRAWLMVACIFIARMFDRNSTPVAGLVLAATLVLLWNPRTLLDIGFQLSYCVVAAILLYGLPLGVWLNSRWTPWLFLPQKSLGRLRRILLRLKYWFCTGLGIGIASSLASAPLIVGHFGLFSAGAVAVNLVAVPLATPIIFAGFLSLIFGTIGCGFLSTPLNWFSGKILNLLSWMANSASSIPGMAWVMEYKAEWIAPFVMFTFLGCLLVIPMRRAWHFLIPPALVFLSFLLGTS
jgi:competence protein ComEC